MTYAVYYELGTALADTVQQFIISPRFHLGNALIPTTLWHRAITKEKPARTWSRSTPSTYYPPEDNHGLALSSLLSHELGQLEGVSSYMRAALADAAYDLYVAFPVLLTDTIKLEMSEATKRSSSSVPTTLLAQIALQRDAIADLPLLPKKN